MTASNVTPLWRDKCGCKVYRTPNGFSIAYCLEHKEPKHDSVDMEAARVLADPNAKV